MNKLDIHPSTIPLHKIIFVTTSDPEYEMDRVIFAEEYPDYKFRDNYVIATGSHCSCYDFDETEWDVIQYTREEIIKLMRKWNEDGYGSERIIAPLILRYMDCRDE